MNCKPFLEKCCNFVPRKFELEDHELEFLFETEKWAWEVFNRYQYFFQSTMVLEEYRDHWQDDILQAGIELGHTKISYELNARVLNYRGQVFFGFRFLPHIYEFMRGDCITSENGDIQSVIDRFVLQHTAYKENSVVNFNRIYAEYKRQMKGISQPIKSPIDMLCAIIKHIPQARSRGTGVGEEVIHTYFSELGLNADKIQSVLNESRKK